jgi:hypothetical protein
MPRNGDVTYNVSAIIATGIGMIFLDSLSMNRGKTRPVKKYNARNFRGQGEHKPSKANENTGAVANKSSNEHKSEEGHGYTRFEMNDIFDYIQIFRESEQRAGGDAPLEEMGEGHGYTRFEMNDIFDCIEIFRKLEQRGGGDAPFEEKGEGHGYTKDEMNDIFICIEILGLGKEDPNKLWGPAGAIVCNVRFIHIYTFSYKRRNHTNTNASIGILWNVLKSLEKMLNKPCRSCVTGSLKIHAALCNRLLTRCSKWSAAKTTYRREPAG